MKRALICIYLKLYTLCHWNETKYITRYPTLASWKIERAASYKSKDKIVTGRDDDWDLKKIQILSCFLYKSLGVLLRIIFYNGFFSFPFNASFLESQDLLSLGKCNQLRIIQQYRTLQCLWSENTASWEKLYL